MLTLYSIPFSCSSSIVELEKSLILLNDFFHNRSCLSDELLKLEGLILIFLFSLVSVFGPVVVSHHVIRSLIEFVLVTKIICLDFLLNGVIGRTVDCGFDGTRLKLVEIEILLCLRDKLKYIEMLLLTKLYKISKFLRPSLLCISCSIVYSLSNDKTLLLRKSIKIFTYI